MNALQVIEKLTGPSQEEVDEILRVIDTSRTWQEANEQLKRFGVEFTDSHPDIVDNNAIGGCTGEWVLLNARHFRYTPTAKWRTVIEHELTHREQMRRAAQRGADSRKVTDRKLAQFTKSGRVDPELYLRDPLEMQALARNAVTAARAAKEDPMKLLRSGGLARYSPLPPLNKKRFHKYAYQMAESVAAALLEENSGLFISAVLTPESQKLLLERVPPVHEWVKAHHMTISFDPPMERYLHYYKQAIGQPMQLEVVGQAADDRVQAVVVRGESENRTPHITVSCASGVNARESNDLLSEGWTPLDRFVLEAVIEVESTSAVTPTTHRQR